MNWIFRAALAGTMAGTLAGAPMYPAQNQAAGIVLEAEGALVGGADLRLAALFSSGTWSVRFQMATRSCASANRCFK
jgi:hypothetical protein